ncbi:hypothetical protein LPJ54_006821, partial [Coemansia sp. RSA 1824]
CTGRECVAERSSADADGRNGRTGSAERRWSNGADCAFQHKCYIIPSSGHHVLVPSHSAFSALNPDRPQRQQPIAHFQHPFPSAQL